MISEKYKCGCTVVDNIHVEPCKKHSEDLGDLIVTRARERQISTKKPLLECLSVVLTELKVEPELANRIRSWNLQ